METLEECTGWAALEKRTITIGLVALEECTVTSVVALVQCTLYRIFGNSGRVHRIFGSLKECTVTFGFSKRSYTVQNLWQFWKGAQHLGQLWKSVQLPLVGMEEYAPYRMFGNYTVVQCTAACAALQEYTVTFGSVEECTVQRYRIFGNSGRVHSILGSSGGVASSLWQLRKSVHRLYTVQCTLLQLLIVTS